MGSHHWVHQWPSPRYAHPAVRCLRSTLRASCDPRRRRPPRSRTSSTHAWTRCATLRDVTPPRRAASEDRCKGQKNRWTKRGARAGARVHPPPLDPRGIAAALPRLLRIHGGRAAAVRRTLSTRHLSPRCGTAAAFAFVRAPCKRKWDRAHFCAMHRVVCVGAVPARPTARPRRYEAEMNNLSAAVHAQESSAHAPNAARTHSPSSTRHYLVRKRKALRCRLPRARGLGEHTCACVQVSNRAVDEALNDTLSSQLQVRSPAAACVECQRNCARVSMGGAACVRVASALKSARRASPTASSGVLCRRASRCASRSGAARSRTVRRRRRASVARHRRRSDRQCRGSSSSSARARRGCISRVKRAPCM